MTKQEFRTLAIYAVEIEYEDGGREWFNCTGLDNMRAFIREEQALGNYYSDSDFAGRQENAEVQTIIDRGVEVFMQDTSKFRNLQEAIDSLLEDDEPQAPAKKEWSEEQIKNLVQTDDRVLYGALKKLYAQQTADEQRAEATKERNNAGFNSYDAQFLTSAAEFLLKTGFLTDKQKMIVRKKLVKYNKQLTRLANA